MSEENVRKIFVQAPSGDRFEAEVPCGTPLSTVAADFFDAQEWPTRDPQGRGQRAVVELVNPKNPDETKRLNSEDDVCEATADGDALRIFPESIAGAVDHKARGNALIADYNDMRYLSERNPTITFEANRAHAPDRYEVTFDSRSFVELAPGERIPRIGDSHRVEIILGRDYPRRAPFVRWLTPIFHPNIRPGDGAVCLGVLQERYLPGLGVARIVRQLAEMIQWRNYDAFNPFNKDAAEWAANPQNWDQIQALGGHPFQGPIADLLKRFQDAGRDRIEFRRLGSAR